MNIQFIIINLIFMGIYIGGSVFLSKLKKKKKTFNTRVLFALSMGLVFGFLAQYLTSMIASGETFDKYINSFMLFLSVFGKGYIGLLQLLIIPLVFVAMITAIMNIKSEKSLSQIVPKVIGLLMVTVAIAAVVGILFSFIFNLDSEAIALNDSVGNSQEVSERVGEIESSQDTLEGLTYASVVLSIIPKNIFFMLTGSEPTATLQTVFIGGFIGYAIMQVRRRKPEKVQSAIDVIEATKEIVLSLVREVLKLTPYGIFAMMASFTVSNSISNLSGFIIFLLASWSAIAFMYLIHLFILFVFGLNPKKFISKSYPVLVFGFSSKSSAAALPLNIEAQTNSLGVDSETASISSTFGTSIGQNGCAGIYPAMIVIMTLAASGQLKEVGFLYFVNLVFVIAIASFGIAGVGGGATFAAVAVLSILGLPIEYAALLVAIEPLIDMARTALNISGSMVVGIVTARLNKTLDIDMYNNDIQNEN